MGNCGRKERESKVGRKKNKRKSEERRIKGRERNGGEKDAV